jgi:hypothetical protein
VNYTKKRLLKPGYIAIFDFISSNSLFKDNFEELMVTGLALGVDQNFVFEKYLKIEV